MSSIYNTNSVQYSGLDSGNCMHDHDVILDFFRSQCYARIAILGELTNVEDEILLLKYKFYHTSHDLRLESESLGGFYPIRTPK